MGVSLSRLHVSLFGEAYVHGFMDGEAEGKSYAEVNFEVQYCNYTSTFTQSTTFGY